MHKVSPDSEWRLELARAVAPAYLAQPGVAGDDRSLLLRFVYDGQHRMLELADGRGRAWYPSGALVPGGTFTHPYRGEDLADLRFAQSADVLFIASPRHAPAKISRYADNDWRYEVLSFTPKTPRPDAPWLEAGGEVPGSGSQSYSYRIVAVNPESGELSLPSPSADITSPSLSLSFFVQVSWNALPGIEEYRVYKKRSGVYGFIGRTTDGATTFRDANIAPDIGDTPPGEKRPFESEGNFPAVAYFLQQRLGFAATTHRPLTIWASQSANFENLAASLPPQDDDGMEATIAGERQTRILWCKGEGRHLVIGTAGGEWLLSPGSGYVISPSSHGFNPQSHIGSQQGVDALRAAEGVLFVQRGGGKIRLLSYNYEEDKFKPKDLSILASHILEGKKVTSWAWQLLPYGIVWMTLADGSLAGLTLLVEHDVIGWHRHETDGFVEQAEVLPSVGNEHDLLWLLVRRNGKRHVEIMSPYFAGADRETAFFVDSGLSWYDTGRTILDGLDHLEGRTVHIFADGAVHPPRRVLGGMITLDYPANVVHAGLPYAMRVAPTTPEPQMRDGSSAGRLKKISSVKVFVHRTLGFRVQSGENKPVQAIYNSFSTPARDLPRFIEYGAVDISLAGGWSENARLTLVSDTPTPCAIVAIVSTVELSPGGKGHQV